MPVQTERTIENPSSSTNATRIIRKAGAERLYLPCLCDIPATAPVPLLNVPMVQNRVHELFQIEFLSHRRKSHIILIFVDTKVNVAGFDRFHILPHGKGPRVSSSAVVAKEEDVICID